MEIIASVSIWKEKAVLLRQIECLHQMNVKILRINMKTLTTDSQIEDARRKLNTIIDKHEDMRFMFDIAYKRDTPRSRVNNQNNRIEITEGENYLITCDKELLQNQQEMKKESSARTPYAIGVYNLTSFPCTLDESVVYGNGEVVFRILSKISKDSVLVRANCSGTVWDGKALHFTPDVYAPVTESSLEIYDSFASDFKGKNRFGIAFSFANQPDELASVAKSRSLFPIVSKIEDEKGVENIGGICEVSDYIYIARGDLGFSFPKSLLDKMREISNATHFSGKKLIVGTDVLESFGHLNIPSRSDMVDMNYIAKLGPDYVVLSQQVISSPFLAEAVSYLNSFFE